MTRRLELWTLTRLLVAACAVAVLAVPASSNAQLAAGGKVLNVGLYIEPQSADPHNVEVGTLLRELNSVYEGLVDVTEKIMVYEPLLATSWTASDDGLSYTFKLRKGVRFSDGTDFNADAVKVNYERVMAIKRGPYAAVKQIKAVEVVDDETVRMRLHQPSGAFLATLRQFMMISPAAIKAHAGSDMAQSWLNEHTAGTGPYKVEQWRRGSVLTLVRNEHSWRGWSGQEFDRINLRVILEAETQRLMLQQGQLDIAQIISVDALPALKRNPQIRVVETEYAGQMYFFLNTALEPTTDMRLRRALAYAWNHEKYKALRKGIGPRADGAAPNVLFGPGYGFKNTYAFDADKARRLLAEAGVTKGTRLTALVQKGDEQKRMLIEVLRDELSALGVEMNFYEGTWPAIWKRMTDWGASRDPALNWHIVVFYKSPDLWTPWTFLYRMFHTDTQLHKPSGQYNLGLYSNPSVDKLITEASVLLDADKATPLWRKANEAIFADLPAIPIEKMVEIAVMRSDIQGYVFRPYETGRRIDFYRLSRAPSR
jgi:peptide/nickel transport system substrate-binding protein